MIKWSKKHISVALPEDLFPKVQELAEESGRTRAAYVRQIIKWYLQKTEISAIEKII